MPSELNRLLFWAPRALCILFIAFVSMFALDVFGAGLGLWRTIAALIIHLIPTWIMLAILIVAWRREWIGAAAFVLCAAGFAYIVRGPWFVKGMFVVPCLFVAWLFLLNWRRRQDGPGMPGPYIGRRAS